MTRKDYKLIAEALLDSKPAEPCESTVYVQFVFSCSRVANALESDNPRFDRNKFMKACGV